MCEKRLKTREKKKEKEREVCALAAPIAPAHHQLILLCLSVLPKVGDDRKDKRVEREG